MSRGRRKGRGTRDEGEREEARSFSGNEGTEAVNWAELAKLGMVYGPDSASGDEVNCGGSMRQYAFSHVKMRFCRCRRWGMGLWF